MCNEHILISLSFGYFACDNVKTSLPALETLLDAWKACFMLEMNINGIENASSTHSLLHLQKGGGIGYTKIFKSVSNLGGFFPKKKSQKALVGNRLFIAGYTLVNKRRPGLKMYSLLNMGIFQPAMLVYQKLSFVVPEE